MAAGVVISAAVEGIVDEAVVRRLIVHAGGTPGTVFGREGKAHLQRKISAYNNAARVAPWIVVVDLNRGDDCAPPLRASWLPSPAPRLCFRVAVRTVEAWLLADGEGLARFLRVPRSGLPERPEELDDPKQFMVNLARASRRRPIVADMVPREGSGRQVGRAYSSTLIQFVSSSWRPEAAAERSDSLRRAIDCLKRLASPG